MASNPSENVKEVFNSSRHEHNLRFFEGQPRYKCTGCKQYGANRGFECTSCPDFVLHEPCAESPDEYIHPLFLQKPFQFRAKANRGQDCDGCGEALRGFMFMFMSQSKSQFSIKSKSKFGKGHLKLHPLCMTLPRSLSITSHKDHSFDLINQGGKYNCTRCNKENHKWKYECQTITCKVNLDMNCAIVNYHGMTEYGTTLVQRPSWVNCVMKKVASVAIFFLKNCCKGLAEGAGYQLSFELFGALCGNGEAKGDDNEEAGEQGGGDGSQPSGQQGGGGGGGGSQPSGQ